MSSTILFQRALQRVNPSYHLIRAWSLTGGVSAQVTALEIETGQGRMKMIVRQHGTRDLDANPHIARDEFALLSHLHSAGLPVPQPYGVDDSGTIFPTPYILMEFIEGQTDFQPPSLTDYVQQCAEHLARIHRVLIQGLAFLPLYRHRAHRLITQPPAELDESLNEGTIRDVLERAWPFAQINETALLHGDFGRAICCGTPGIW